jgi:cytochrome c-type biogenesis protein CcmF
MELIFIAEWGHLLLWGAFALSILAIVTQLNPHFQGVVNSPVIFSLSQLFFVLLSFVLLMTCFVYNDFTLQYVAANSHTQLPWYYKITAVWGAHEGSLLLWVLILAFWQYWLSRDNYLPKQVLLVSSIIFIALLSLVLFSSNPFLRWLPDSPTEGLDLNPLLQDPAFVIHPPMLYLGYVGFVMPFILTMSTLLNPRNFNLDRYIDLMRKWSLLAFGFLTLGIALGSWWAYYELGWGGWWFWDPVENASFMPWLSGLALIHSLLVVKNRPHVIGWVMILSIVTFGLSILGTFLVRSGIITSVHSFASDPERGLFILGILLLTIGSAFVLLIIQAKHFMVESHKAFKLNAHAMCIGASVVLFCLMIVILLGTTYPILAEMAFSENVTIGLPYFNKVTLPFFGLLLLFSAVGPYLPFKKKQIALIGLSGILSLVITFLVFKNNIIAGIGLFLGIWLLLNTCLNFIFNFNSQVKKLGMVLAHIGFAIGAIGAVVNTQWITEKEMELSVGQKIQVGKHYFELVSLGDRTGPNFTAKTAVFNISEQDQMSQIRTEKRYYTNRQMALSETGILPGFMQDIYISLGEPIDAQTWSVKIIIHPLVRWLWLGAILIALGAFLSFIIRKR